jgi:protein arginine N-methyltransferase 1
MKYVRCPDLSVAFGDGQSLILRATSRGRAARVPAFAAAVLAACDEPRSEDEVAAEFGEPGRRLFAGLVRAGLLLAPDEAADTPLFFENFSAIDVHRRMLADEARLNAYEAAIRELVGPESVVADGGTGSGVLACLAARAGARRVYGVDRSDLLDVASQIVARSGLEDRVSLVRGDLRTVELPEPVDLIITETFGAMALAEGSPADVAAFAQRCLAPSGRVMPDSVELWLAPTSDPTLLREAFGPFEPARGIDFTPLADMARGRSISREISPDSLAHPGLRFAHLDYPDTPWPEARLEFGPIAPTAIGASLTGFAGWFVLALSPSVSLATGPHDPLTHWRQVYFPIASGPALDGSRLTVDVRMESAADDRRSVDLSLGWTLAGATGHARFRVR